MLNISWVDVTRSADCALCTICHCIKVFLAKTKFIKKDNRRRILTKREKNEKRINLLQLLIIDLKLNQKIHYIHNLRIFFVGTALSTRNWLIGMSELKIYQCQSICCFYFSSSELFEKKIFLEINAKNFQIQNVFCLNFKVNRCHCIYI